MKRPTIQRVIIIASAVLVVVIIGGLALNHFFRQAYLPPEGFVPDEETAIRIAEAIWLPIYGEGIYEKQPFVADYDWISGCWKVEGTLPENMLGGVPEAQIRKSDGKIVFVFHGK